ncbi:hypothetical protein [Thermococcus thioreducens]|uniref:Uncharacterized protein n=1 Tax=Thermococcus thioreducens TaxID=277988 RepID=A0A0Q2ULE9_9EURY|nr:hypothetical protein [Thermococcus thioreducens]ASJ12989.1 hypothetical protein A3L14_08860 [Thermococcus thioreducens]KQH81464.1 hypothetical protein AMR53_11250 [Thermococcus thioreducens]SEV82575.1 hypothetical protein SAMN05216170_0167 [Thermococcus thioreducens]
MGRIASLIIAVLLVVAASLGYLYHQGEREVKAAVNGLFGVSNTALFCLEDMNAIAIMLENNVSNDVLRERLGRYAYCSVTLEKAAFSLYLLDGDESYWRLHVAASNLEIYFHTAMNSPNPREKVSDNVEIINEISREINAILQNGGVKGLNDAQAEKLFNLTQSLLS